MNKPSLNGASNLSKNGINQSFKDTKDNLSNYISILRANLLPIILITLASIIITLIYVFNAKDIYKSYSTIKINRPQGSVLSSSLIPEFQDFITDRYISNEIEVLKSYKIREKVAENMIDTFKLNQDKDKFYYLFHSYLRLIGKEFKRIQMIGSCTVTSLVPSGKVASIWMSGSISAMPSITSARVNTVRPSLIS